MSMDKGILKRCVECKVVKLRDDAHFQHGCKGWSSRCRQCKFNRPHAVARRGYDYAEHCRRMAKLGIYRA